VAIPAPPQIELAQEQFREQLKAVENRDIDPDVVPWPELEKSVVKLLGGAFDPEKPEHQAIALGLAGSFAQRLATESNAFWFQNRESIEGAALGFPDALIVLSPFGAAMDALAQARLAKLDELQADIRKSLAQVKFGAGGGPGGMRLSPIDYERLFDPGFLQFTVMDSKKTKDAWETPTSKVARDVRDAVGRASQLPPEAKKQLESQLVGTLDRMDGQKSLLDQAERAGRVTELLGHLFATTASTGSAPEEFWHDLVFPLLYIGAPATFPPVEAEELEAYSKGVDPLFLFVDLVPYQSKAEEGALLDTFPPQELQLPHPAMARIRNLHLVKLPKERLQPLVQGFDAAKTRDAIERFGALLKEKTGKPAAVTEEAKAMLDGALSLLADLKQASDVAKKENGELYLRRLTEAEASSEPALALVRTALSAPRIILA
jgi:hypothetical protein